MTTVLRSLVDVAASGADEDQMERATQEATDVGHLPVRKLPARAEEVDVLGALRIERALHGMGAS